MEGKFVIINYTFLPSFNFLAQSFVDENCQSLKFAESVPILKNLDFFTPILFIWDYNSFEIFVFHFKSNTNMYFTLLLFYLLTEESRTTKKWRYLAINQSANIVRVGSNVNE